MATLFIDNLITMTGVDWADHPITNPGFRTFNSQPVDLATWKYFMPMVRWSNGWGTGDWTNQCGVQWTVSDVAYDGSYDNDDRYGARIPIGDATWAPLWRDGAPGPDGAGGEASQAKFFRTRPISNEAIQRGFWGSPAMGYGLRDNGDPKFKQDVSGGRTTLYGYDVKNWEGQSYSTRTPLSQRIFVAGFTQMRASITATITGDDPPYDSSAYIKVSILLSD